jgi:hypothetical protein
LQVIVIYKSNSRQLIVHVEDKKAKSIVAEEIFNFFVFENDIIPNNKPNASSSNNLNDNYFQKPRTEINLENPQTNLLESKEEKYELQLLPKKVKLKKLQKNDVYLSTGKVFVDVKETFENIESQNYFGTCVETQKRIKLDFMAINLLSENSNRKLRVFFLTHIKTKSIEMN